MISGVINSFIYFIVNCIVKKNTVWSIGTIIVLCNLVKINNLKNFEKARISGWLVIIISEIIYAKLYFCYQRVFVSSYSIILYLNIISKKKITDIRVSNNIAIYPEFVETNPLIFSVIVEL